LGNNQLARLVLPEEAAARSGLIRETDGTSGGWSPLLEEWTKAFFELEASVDAGCSGPPPTPTPFGLSPLPLLASSAVLTKLSGTIIAMVFDTTSIIEVLSAVPPSPPVEVSVA